MAYVSARELRYRSRTLASSLVAICSDERYLPTFFLESLRRLIDADITTGVINAPETAFTRSHAVAGFLKTRLCLLNILEDSILVVVIKAVISARKVSMKALPNPGVKHSSKNTVKEQRIPLSLHGSVIEEITPGETFAKQLMLIPIIAAGGMK